MYWLLFIKLVSNLRTIFTSQGLRSTLCRADRNPWLAKMLWNIHLSFLNGKILQIIYSITGALYNKILLCPFNDLWRCALHALFSLTLSNITVTDLCRDAQVLGDRIPHLSPPLFLWNFFSPFFSFFLVFLWLTCAIYHQGNITISYHQRNLVAGAG